MNSEQFTQFIARYQRPLLSAIYKMVSSREAARDIAQESFTRMWQKYKYINNAQTPFYVLYRIAINLSIDYLRKAKDFTYEISNLISEGDDWREDSEEFFQILLQCASELKPKQKAVFILRDIEGFDFDEISDILMTPVENLRSNLSLARKKIKNLLETRYRINQEFFYEL